MPDDKSSLDTRNPWLIDARELGRRAGLSRDVRREVPVNSALGFPGVIVVPEGSEIELDLLLESVVEGVLVTGTALAHTTGECARCLDPIEGDVEIELTELFAYPDSTTEATTEEGEVSRLVDDRIDLEPVVRDALVLTLPQAPLCAEDCPGLCPECGGKWADLEAGHGHETIDPRWAALVERFGDSPAEGPDREA